MIKIGLPGASNSDQRYIKTVNFPVKFVPANKSRNGLLTKVARKLARLNKKTGNIRSLRMMPGKPLSNLFLS
jgi:hypothetical protein